MILSAIWEVCRYEHFCPLFAKAVTRANDDFESKTWMDSNPPSGALAKCRACGQNMTLLLQLNADIPDRFPNHTRWLYIFGCSRAACNRKPGSIRAYRAVKRTKEEALPKTDREEKSHAPADDKKPGLGLGAQLFGSSPTPAEASGNSPVNPFATSSNSSVFNNSQSSSPFATSLSTTFAEKARISSPSPSTSTAPSVTTSKKTDGPTTPWPDAAEFPEPYPRYHLDADYETLSGPEELDITSKVDVQQMELEDSTPSSSKKNNAANTKEDFESLLDKAFFRFSTRLDQNPDQVLRYEFGGRPLLYSNDDPVGKLLAPHVSAETRVKPTAGSVPYCPQCKSERTFELQLVPHAISALEEDNDISLDDVQGGVPGMEWGTIIVFVCAMDCAPVSVGEVDYREEWVGVQWEEQIMKK